MDDSAQTVECDTCGTRVPIDTVVDDAYDDYEAGRSPWYCARCTQTDLEGVEDDEQSRSAYWAAVDAAGNPTTPPEVLRALVHDHGYVGVHGAAASNPSTPPDVLEALATDINVWVRRDVARHPHTPPEVLRLLADDEYACTGVASNPSTPPEVLIALAGSDELVVLSALAANPALATEVRMAAQLRAGRDTGGR